MRLGWLSRFRCTPRRILLIVVLTLHAGLLAWSGYCHSPTYSELFLLPAGVSHLKFGRFDLYRVNPPLIRMVAAIPVFMMKHDEDWRDYDADPLNRAEYAVGLAFFTANDSQSIWFVILGRWICIPFSILGGLVCYWWANQLYGIVSGFIALILWTTSPYILGHAALLTSDAHAAALGVAATYALWRWLQQPNLESTLLAGIALGIVQLSKLTFVSLIPVWPLLWIAYRLSDREAFPSTHWVREAGQMLSLLMICILVINLGYAFEGTGRQLGNYRFKSLTMTGASNLSDVPEVGANRFASGWLSVIPIPLPCNYVQGIDCQKADFERAPWSFLNGSWQRGGWWYFHLYALVMKLPLGLWCLLILTASVSTVRKAYRLHWRDEIVLLLPIVVILLLLCWQSGLGLHSRYALPILPFIFIWVSKLGKAFQYSDRLFGYLVIGLVVWAVESTLYFYPHNLTYFNELTGGAQKGAEHLALSDSSWGQDLIYLKWWLTEHADDRPIQIASCGPLDPRLVGIDVTLPPVGPRSAEFGGDCSTKLVGPLPGWFAVDSNLLIGGDPLSSHNGRGSWESLSQKVNGHDLTYFRRFTPVARSGYSFHIFHISVDEANQVRRELGLELLR